uniref:NADH-ubiquinone oxidoreductase chain 2 n=1 Tax=Prismognathus prossi TaxID=618395 RepID=A0A5C1VA40_9SCAR|nr:NADH dehydrogenase subunit 2 [Prismognathus prossi]QEN73222.1 NADH dehydrogenase subunit 2 [Prismognathus prossi]
MAQLNKILFCSSLALGTLIAISSYSWMGMWLGLEINLLSFLPLMSSPKNVFTSESALKYFISQALASAILLMSLILFASLSVHIQIFSVYLSMILNSSLFLKMGAAPLHFWFPEVIEGLSWFNSLILLTWQKIAPMALLTYTTKAQSLSIIIVISCMMVSGISGQNQISLRKIMAYSSINHIGWMITAALFFETVWVVYFLIYTIITVNIVLMFKNYNLFSLTQMISSMNSNPMIKLFFILNFLSLGGLPPFLGFLPKWITIQVMVQENLFLTAVILTVSTLMTLYFYLRVTFSTNLFSMSTSFSLKDSPYSLFVILTSNLVTLAGLVMITLVFNYL